MRARYRIGEMVRKDGKRRRTLRTGRMREKGALARLRSDLETSSGPFAVKFEEKRHRYQKVASAEEAVERVRDRLHDARFKMGEVIWIKAGREEYLFFKVYPSVRLPQGADKWSKESKRVFRFVMWRPGWEWWGGMVCRRNRRDGTRWSEHSWVGNAHDFHPRSMRAGDRVFEKVRKRFKGVLIWREPLHFDHAHWQHRTHPRGSVPPCAK